MEGFEVAMVIRGGTEISELYPGKFEQFQERVSELLMQEFPLVYGCIISSEPTEYHQQAAMRAGN